VNNLGNAIHYILFHSISGTPVSLYRPLAQAIFKSPILTFENSNSFYASLKNEILPDSAQLSPVGVYPLLVRSSYFSHRNSPDLTLLNLITINYVQNTYGTMHRPRLEIPPQPSFPKTSTYWHTRSWVWMSPNT
jgi:predicted AlkP superfamily pyrophosphatase or phosphodiesterase